MTVCLQCVLLFSQDEMTVCNACCFLAKTEMMYLQCMLLFGHSAPDFKRRNHLSKCFCMKLFPTLVKKGARLHLTKVTASNIIWRYVWWEFDKWFNQSAWDFIKWKAKTLPGTILLMMACYSNFTYYIKVLSS